MNLRRTFLSALAVLAFAACAPVEAPAQEAPVEIVLVRTACYGFCPDYTVTVTGDGHVRYEGRRFVNAVGQRTAQIPAADVARLLQRFDAVRFESLRDAYRANVTDLPTYTIRLTRNGRTKTLVDYGGTSAGMPEVVRDLQDEIDRVAGTAQWVLRDGQPVRDRPQP